MQPPVAMPVLSYARAFLSHIPPTSLFLGVAGCGKRRLYGLGRQSARGDRTLMFRENRKR